MTRNDHLPETEEITSFINNLVISELKITRMTILRPFFFSFSLQNRVSFRKNSYATKLITEIKTCYYFLLKKTISSDVM